MNRANLVKHLFLATASMLLLLLVSGPKPVQATAQPAAVVPSMPPAWTDAVQTAAVPEFALSRVDVANAPNIPPAYSANADDIQVAGTTVTVTTHITGSADAEIIQGYPTANCGNKDARLIRAGYDSDMTPDGQIVRSLVNFNLASIPQDAVIHNAALKLYVAGVYDVPGQSMLATPYRVSSFWYENAVTWSTQPSWAEPYSATSIPDAYGWASFDITALVQGWVNGSYPNYGLVVRGRETSAGWRAFGARNAAIDPGPTWIPPHLDMTYSFEQDFRMFLVANHHTLEPGDSAASILYLDQIGWFDQSVTLSVSGMPPHASYALGQTTIVPTGTTSLHITTTSLTPLGTYTITVTGTSADKVNTVQGILTVIEPDFELSVSPSARTIGAGDQTTLTVDLVSIWGFADPVTLELGGLPAHTGYAWNPNPATPTGSVRLTITADAEVLVGSYPCVVTGTSGSLVHSAPFTLNISEPMFELSLANVEQSITPGGSTQFTVSVARIGPFTDGVSLTVGSLPAYTTHGWSQNPVMPPGSSILTVDTTPATPVGEYTLIMTGSGGGKTAVVSATLRVTEHTVYLPLVLKERTSSGSGQVQSSSTVDRIALLIGVANYQETGDISAGENRTRKEVNLLFSDDDPPAIQGEIVRPTGTSGSNFNPGNVIVLLDSEATKGAIHDAIVNRIAPLVGEDTLVLIFFSGHGLYTDDDDGDEDDPYDEFIVPYGINVNDGGPLYKLIRDDELASWLSELKSTRVVVVIDTCFSGGMVSSAGADNRIKSLSAYFAPQASLSAQDWQDGFAQDIQGSGRIILMASGESESSIESSALGQGVFTYYFAEALRSPSADTSGNGWVSVEEAFAYLQPKVQAYVAPDVQNPQISDGVPGEVDMTVPLTTVTSCPSW